MLENIKTNLRLAVEQLAPSQLLYCVMENFKLAGLNISLGWLGQRKIWQRYHSRSAPLLWPKFAPARASSLLMVAGLSGLLFFSFHLRTHYKLEPVTYAAPARQIAKKSLPAKTPPKTLPASNPIELKISSVNIDTPVVPTYLTPDGSIAVPNTPYEAGWYNRSPTPGQLGPSIIVGHVDYLTGIAVFWRLRYVQPGAEIDVTRANGSIARFSVDSIQQYSDVNFPSSVVYGNIDHAGIRLITCGGVFNTATRHYSDNTVVFGTLE